MSSSSARPVIPVRLPTRSGMWLRMAEPSMRSITKNGASNTAGSAHATIGRAIVTGSSLIASRIRYSRSTSCALATLA